MSASEELRAAAERLREVARAATPGPWEHGDRQHIAGVNDMFGKGSCAWCDRSDPTWVGQRDTNGTKMLAHVHEKETPWWEHGIYAYREDGSEVVVNDTDEYGYMRDEDARFIALMDPTTALLVADVLEGHDELHNTHDCTFDPCPNLALARRINGEA